MASRYWVGGTAAWDGTAGTKWALTSGGAGGQAIPTSADDVFFTNLSTGTCTISTGNTGAKSITCTGFTGTLAGTADISVAGSVVLVAGQTVTYTGLLTLTATGTLTTGGKTLDRVEVNAVGGTVTLGSALTISNNFTVTAGTFTTSASNYSMTMPGFVSSNTNTRTISFNGSTVTLTNTGTTLNFSTATGLTFTAGTSSIVQTAPQAFFNGGGKTFNNVSFTSTALSNGQITGANTFAQLTLTAPTTANISPYMFSANQTITTFIASGTSAVNRVFLYSNTLGTARTITATTWTTVTDVDFRNITLTNAKSGTRLGDCGGNTNVTFVTQKFVYWNLAGVQDWSATGWAATSGGAPSINNFPLPQDAAVFNEAGAAGTVTISTNYNLPSIVGSGRSSAMTLTLSASPALYSSLSLGNGFTLSGSGTLNISGVTQSAINTAGKTVPWNIVVNAPSSIGGVLLAGALTTSNASGLTLYGGKIDLNGFTLTTSNAVNGLAVTNIYNIAKNITFNGGTILLAGTAGFTNTATDFTSTAGTGTGTITLTSASSKTFAGNGAVFNCVLNQGGAGALNITGANTFSNISNSYSATAATTITLAANQTVSNFTATGTNGKTLTLNSSVAGTARTLTKTSGTVGVNYLSIRDSTATGGAAWYAGANSTNVSNNTGWIFANAPLVSGNFLMMFM